MTSLGQTVADFLGRNGWQRDDRRLGWVHPGTHDFVSDTALAVAKTPDAAARIVKKQLAWSFSHVENFETCGRKYYHQVVRKDVTDDTTYRTQGNEVHAIMARALRGVEPLPSHLKQHQRFIDEVLQSAGWLGIELKLAFTENGEPTDFFDKVRKPWCRLVLDVFRPRGSRALVWDWKTGRMKPNRDQLMLYALGVFMTYPEVKTVDAALIFLKENHGPQTPRNDCIFELTINPKAAQQWWKTYVKRVRSLERALQTSEFHPTAAGSGLCRGYCNVLSCEHNSKYER